MQRESFSLNMGVGVDGWGIPIRIRILDIWITRVMQLLHNSQWWASQLTAPYFLVMTDVNCRTLRWTVFNAAYFRTLLGIVLEEMRERRRKLLLGSEGGV